MVRTKETQLSKIRWISGNNLSRRRDMNNWVVEVDKVLVLLFHFVPFSYLTPWLIICLLMLRYLSWRAIPSQSAHFLSRPHRPFLRSSSSSSSSNNSNCGAEAWRQATGGREKIDETRGNGRPWLNTQRKKADNLSRSKIRERERRWHKRAKNMSTPTTQLFALRLLLI